MQHDEIKYNVFDWLRFPLIVFVVYIHSFGEPKEVGTIDFGSLSPMDFYNLFRISISHVLTHIAVPTFFFISGYLFFGKLEVWNKAVYLDKLKRRVRTLLIPYLIWNTLYILLTVQSISRHEGLDALLAFLDEKGWLLLYWKVYLVPLWYIRDLMVVSLLSPLIYYLFKHARLFGLFLLLVCYVVPTDIKFLIPLKTAFFFFGFGAYLRLHKADPTTFTEKYKYALYILAFLLWIIDTRFDGHNTTTGNLIYPFFIIAGSLAMINLATTCIRKGWQIPRFLIQSTFFVYVSHEIMITDFSGILLRHVFGQDNMLSLYASYLLAPVLAVTVCLLLYAFLKRFFPKTCTILTGQRA